MGCVKLRERFLFLVFGFLVGEWVGGGCGGVVVGDCSPRTDTSAAVGLAQSDLVLETFPLLGGSAPACAGPTCYPCTLLLASQVAISGSVEEERALLNLQSSGQWNCHRAFCGSAPFQGHSKVARKS